MKNLKILFVFAIGLCLLLLSNSTKAQNVLDGVYVKEHVPNRQAIQYTHLREADVMWSKRIWRTIDLREKINEPLYFPTKPINARKSLITVIMDAVKADGYTAYSPGAIGNDDKFTTPLTSQELETLGGAGWDTVMVTDPETGELYPEVTKNEFKPEEVKQFLVKEDWFFDKQRSVMDVRIIGLAPIRHYTKEGSDDVYKSILFWIYFPEYRSVFAKSELFNIKNDSERRTIDDVFWKRMFSSFITKESNVYDDREISTYYKGIEAQLESEKIKNDIFLLEHDLWEY